MAAGLRRKSANYRDHYLPVLDGPDRRRRHVTTYHKRPFHPEPPATSAAEQKFRFANTIVFQMCWYTKIPSKNYFPVINTALDGTIRSLSNRFCHSIAFIMSICPLDLLLMKKWLPSTRLDFKTELHLLVRKEKLTLRSTVAVYRNSVANDGNLALIIFLPCWIAVSVPSCRRRRLLHFESCNGKNLVVYLVGMYSWWHRHQPGAQLRHDLTPRRIRADLFAHGVQ